MATERYDVLTARTVGDKSYFTKIGVAFPMKNRPGFNIIFEALPIPQMRDGKLECTVMMMPPRERQPGEESRGAASHAGLDDDVPFMMER